MSHYFVVTFSMKYITMCKVLCGTLTLMFLTASQPTWIPAYYCLPSFRFRTLGVYSCSSTYSFLLSHYHVLHFVQDSCHMTLFILKVLSLFVLNTVMAHGPKKHQKRAAAPKDRMLDKLTGMFAPCPWTGPRRLREYLPPIFS